MALEVSGQRKSLVASLLIALFGIILYSYRIGYPESMYFDEVYHVATGREFLNLSPFTENVHPPLGKLFISLSIAIFGNHSWSWRLPSLFCGILSLVVLFHIVFQLTKNYFTSLLSVFFFLLDGLSMTQARIAMLNAPMLFFMLLSLWGALLFEAEQSPKWRFLCLSGISLGLAVATRFVALGIIMPIAMVLGRWVWRNLFTKKLTTPRASFVFMLLLFYGLVPFLIYFAAHIIIPVIFHRNLLSAQGFFQAVRDIWDYQINMFHYHVTLKESHRYGSSWLDWPLMSRPIWFHYKEIQGQARGILCLGNPAIFWMMPLAIGYSLFNCLKRKDFAHVIAVIGFLSQWLPWALISRVKFFHYFYACMPFVALSLSLLVQRLLREGPVMKGIVIGYLVFVIVSFAYWYPLYVGYPMSIPALEHHLWFNRWI